MNKLRERFWKWNIRRLDNSEHYDVVFVISNPVNLAVLRQSAKEFSIPYKEGHLKGNNDVKIFICPNCGRNERLSDFLASIRSKTSWPHNSRRYLPFRAQLWKFAS